MRDPNDIIAAAHLEHMMSRARVRNLRCTFDVEQPDGTTVPFELILPAGELRTETGRELEGGFYESGLSPLGYGRWVMRLNLFPDPSLQEDRQLIVRVVPE